MGKLLLFIASLSAVCGGYAYSHLADCDECGVDPASCPVARVRCCCLPGEASTAADPAASGPLLAVVGAAAEVGPTSCKAPLNTALFNCCDLSGEGDALAAVAGAAALARGK